MPVALLRILTSPQALRALQGLLGAFGLVAGFHRGGDGFFDLGDNPVISPPSVPSDDNSIDEPVFDSEKNEKKEITPFDFVNAVDLSISNDVLNQVNENIDEEKLEIENSETLIGVLKNNSISLNKILASINDAIVANTTSSIASNSLIIKELHNINLFMQNIVGLFLYYLTYVVDNPRKLEVLKSEIESIKNGYEDMKNGYNDIVDKFDLLSDDFSFIKEKVTEIEDNVEDYIGSVKDKYVSKLENLVDGVNENLGVIAKAKVLEKEYYEFMKTPQTYTLSDETLPNLSPREVVALSEAIKAHLNSQEASLTGEELSDFEDDFDLGDILIRLFNFKGISEDISKLRR